MGRNGSRVIAFTFDQLTTTEKFQRGLDGAFRQAGFFRERAQTGRHPFPFCARGLAVKMKINKIRRRLAIVPDDVAHQNVENIVVDWDAFAETMHAKSKK